MPLLSVTKNIIGTGGSSEVRLYRGPRVGQRVAWWTSTLVFSDRPSSDRQHDQVTGVGVGLRPQFSDVTLMNGHEDAA